MKQTVLESGSIVLLTEEDVAYLDEFEAAIRRNRERVGTSREAAMRELIDAGVYGEDGQLTAQYR
jgi:hypothetical protein